jgi:hypothetical protein
MMRKIRSFVLLLVLCFAFTAGAAAQATATLSVGSASGDPGDTGISIPVTLTTNGASIASLQFTISFDNSQLVLDDVEVGSAAAEVDKVVSWNEGPSPRLIIVFGPSNNYPIGSGPAVNLIFNVKSSAPSGTTTLGLSGVVLSDPGGGPVSSDTNNGTFTVIAPPTSTPTNTVTNTPTVTQTPTVTRTPTITRTPTQSLTPGPTNTPGPPTKTPTITNTSWPSATPTVTPTLTGSETPTPSDTPGPSPTATPTPEALIKGAGPDEIELAIAATGTAIAELDAAVAGTATAQATPRQEPVEPPPESSSWLSRWVDFVVLGGVILGLALSAAGLYFILKQKQREGSEDDPEEEHLSRLRRWLR